MWRNGRRNGLKIRFRESEVWVRVPPSALSKGRFVEGESPNHAVWTVAHGHARKRSKSKSIRQLFDLFVPRSVALSGRRRLHLRRL